MSTEAIPLPRPERPRVARVVPEPNPWRAIRQELQLRERDAAETTEQ